MLISELKMHLFKQILKKQMSTDVCYFQLTRVYALRMINFKEEVSRLGSVKCFWRRCYAANDVFNRVCHCKPKLRQYNIIKHHGRLPLYFSRAAVFQISYYLSDCCFLIFFCNIYPYTVGFLSEPRKLPFCKSARALL